MNSYAKDSKSVDVKIDLKQFILR